MLENKKFLLTLQTKPYEPMGHKGFPVLISQQEQKCLARADISYRTVFLRQSGATVPRRAKMQPAAPTLSSPLGIISLNPSHRVSTTSSQSLERDSQCRIEITKGHPAASRAGCMIRRAAWDMPARHKFVRTDFLTPQFNHYCYRSPALRHQI